MKGIPAELHKETLNKTLEKLPNPSGLVFTNMFPSVNYDSDRIRWIMEYGTAGMTPFVAPGAPSPVMGDDAMYSEGSAAAAYWKEKHFIDETRLNNLREPLTATQRQTAQRQIARQQRRLRNRCIRRREWMMAKCFADNKITYQREGGTKFTVDYGVPEHHKQSLTGEDVWQDADGSTGTSATPIKDIYELKENFVDDVGVNPTDFFINSNILKILMFNSDIQDVLKKSNFGEGDLFASPQQVIGQLLGMGNLNVYDDVFEVGSLITQDVSSGSSVTINVDDATDMESGQKARIYDLTKPYTYEETNITAVDVVNNTVTVDTLGSSYKAGQAQLVMRKKFIPNDKIIAFSRTVDDEKIAEFMNAPFGNERNFGMYADSREEWDPEGIWMRVQNKGLPVLYHPDCVYTLNVIDNG